jgi:inorganic pyrophosphatase
VVGWRQAPRRSPALYRLPPASAQPLDAGRLFTAISYRGDYGFIRKALAEDTAKLDVRVVVEDPTFKRRW